MNGYQKIASAVGCVSQLQYRGVTVDEFLKFAAASDDPAVRGAAEDILYASHQDPKVVAQIRDLVWSMEKNAANLSFAPPAAQFADFGEKGDPRFQLDPAASQLPAHLPQGMPANLSPEEVKGLSWSEPPSRLSAAMARARAGLDAAGGWAKKNPAAAAAAGTAGLLGLGGAGYAGARALQDDPWYQPALDLVS